MKDVCTKAAMQLLRNGVASNTEFSNACETNIHTKTAKHALVHVIHGCANLVVIKVGTLSPGSIDGSLAVLLLQRIVWEAMHLNLRSRLQSRPYNRIFSVPAIIAVALHQPSGSTSDEVSINMSLPTSQVGAGNIWCSRLDGVC